MSKKTDSAKTAGEKHAAPQDPTAWVRTFRETVESVAIAFILAFMFRTFEAEAFVIPTGSMAPTLQGRHKDIVCPECGYVYRVGASEEVDRETSVPKASCRMKTVTCPMCRYTMDVDNPQDPEEYPSYNGDRIIVNKFAYDLADPQRWDVVVFKYPEDAKENYIKRLIGLPGERIWLHNGDVYTAPLGSENFQIARKPPEKLAAIMQPVYDNDNVIPKLIQAGLPPRWQPWAAPASASPWKTSADFKSFQTEGASQPAWLRYQNILPDDNLWDDVKAGRPFHAPSPSLIKDFYAYNDGDFPDNCDSPPPAEVWVGDLALECTLTVKNTNGGVILELVKGGRQFRCHIDLASGLAKLSISGKPDFAPTAATAIRAPGTYQVRFSNVDEQLLLWINDMLVDFNAPTSYAPLNNTEAVVTAPVPGSEEATDLSPVGIAAEPGAVLDVSHLKIRRDVYYLSREDNVYPGNRLRSSIDLQADQFFMLGDNSPKSSDGRFWRSQNYVDRQLLIGKALFVYWPHSFNYLEIGDKKIPFPFWPNFSRMRFVH
ncbi:MAG TPA: signal peptidase I [Pirellulales bacterium]|nr:signal peptidase I [Pirellulales bacterium]